MLRLFVQAAKSIKTSEYMPYIVFIAAPPVEIQRNMHEYARLKGKTDQIRGVRSTVLTFRHFSDFNSADDRDHALGCCLIG